MDSSWIEVLPLPKSRPGWVAAILLFMLTGGIFLPFQPRLAEKAIIEIDTKESFSDSDIDGIYQISYPKILSPDSTIPITFRISSDEEPPLQIQSAGVVWTCYFYSNGQLWLNDRRFVTTDELLISSNESIFIFQMPNCVMDKTHEIRGSFYITLAHSNKRVEFSNNVITIEINRWKAYTNPILHILTTLKYGLIGIALLSLISVWLVEYKKHQDIWLTSKEGWNIARQTFIRASIGFLIILGILITLLVSNKYIGIVIIVILFTILLTWLFQPNLQAIWKIIRMRQIGKIQAAKLSEDATKIEAEKSSTVILSKSVSSEKKTKSTTSRNSSSAKAPEKKRQKTSSKPPKRL